MTEAEWLASRDSAPMMRFLAGQPEAGGPLVLLSRLFARPAQPPSAVYSPRKARLFACACCRNVEEVLSDDAWRWAIGVSEKFADAACSEDDLTAARDGATKAWEGLLELELPPRLPALYGPRLGDGQFRAWSGHCAVAVTMLDPFAAVLEVNHAVDRLALDAASTNPQWSARAWTRAPLLRDIFGPLPFRSIATDQRWLVANAGAVARLAESIYADRAFDRLPILADALEDAGCHHSDILAHSRDGGEHVRGCWVLDLLTSRR